MNADELTTLQKVALTEELDAAVKLIGLGVTALRELDAANDFYHLPMQLLAQGLERFLKLTYAMAELNATESLPLPRTIRGFGHDLVALTDGLGALVAKVDEYATRPAVQQDLEFMRADKDLRRMLTLLSDFGRRGRYHRLDEFLSPEIVDGDADPTRGWQELEMEISQRSRDWADTITTPDGAGEIHRWINGHLSYRVERLAQAIARMWTLGALPPHARTNTAVIAALLRDPETVPP